MVLAALDRRRFLEPLLRAARLRHPGHAAGRRWPCTFVGAEVRISAAPVPGQTVDPQTYDADYKQEVHTRGVPFLGDAML